MNRPSSAPPRSGSLEDLLPEDPCENEILDQLHRQRDEHAARFGNDPKRISADLNARAEAIPIQRSNRRPASKTP